MRRLKLTIPMLAAVMAVVLAVGTSAFTAKKNTKPPVENYFELSSLSFQSSATARTNPANWVLANGDGSDIACSNGNVNMCKIKAQNDNGHPVIGSSGTYLYDKLYNSGSSAIPAQDATVYWTRDDDN